MRWIARDFTFDFPRPMVVMGIVNTTPDSFADGGHFLNSGSAVDHALRLADEGAEIIDIGGESTRPGSAPVSEEEELRRVVPVIERLAKRSEVALSVDTQKPVVAKAALDAGASIVNDVAANRESPQMWQVVAGAGAGYVCMHMRGTPQTMQAKPRYNDVVREVGGFFKKRLARLAEHGVSDAQVALDPGIGFGKTLDHNIKLLSRLNKFTMSQSVRYWSGFPGNRSSGICSGRRSRTGCPPRSPARFARWLRERISSGCMTWPKRCRPSVWRRR